MSRYGNSRFYNEINKITGFDSLSYKKRFLSIRKDSHVQYGIHVGENYIFQIDLVLKKTNLLTNPVTSHHYKEFLGVKWVKTLGFDNENKGFICDDEDGVLWFDVGLKCWDGSNEVLQTELIDDDEKPHFVCIDLKLMKYYYKNNASWNNITL